MGALVLTINPGSSSREYALYDGTSQIMRAYYEHNGSRCQLSVRYDRAKPTVDEISQSDFDQALDHFLKRSAQTQGDFQLAGIGIRLVVPGRRFLQHHRLDAEIHEYLRQNISKAPLHLTIVLNELDQLEHISTETPIFLISDSAFHKSITHEARNYAIPFHDADRFDVYRFGYHGLSIGSVVRQLNDLNDQTPANLIVCHLGSGASITAVKNGQSLDTSMGYSPLEGLIMSTRVGNIDVEAAVQLKKNLEMSDDELIEYLNTRSGLLGLSGISNDIRQLLEEEMQGNERAMLTLNSMVYRIRFYIGAYHALLGGLDAIVFTATAGVRSHAVRARVCQGLAHLGVLLDDDRNQQTVEQFARVSHDDSKTAIMVVSTDETGEIAHSVNQLLN